MTAAPKLHPEQAPPAQTLLKSVAAPPVFSVHRHAVGDTFLVAYLVVVLGGFVVAIW